MALIKFKKKKKNAGNEPKRGFAVRACKINVESDIPQTYQEAVQCAEKDQ